MTFRAIIISIVTFIIPLALAFDFEEKSEASNRSITAGIIMLESEAIFSNHPYYKNLSKQDKTTRLNNTIKSLEDFLLQAKKDVLEIFPTAANSIDVNNTQQIKNLYAAIFKAIRKKFSPEPNNNLPNSEIKRNPKRHRFPDGLLFLYLDPIFIKKYQNNVAYINCVGFSYLVSQLLSNFGLSNIELVSVDNHALVSWQDSDENRMYFNGLGNTYEINDDGQFLENRNYRFVSRSAFDSSNSMVYLAMGNLYYITDSFQKAAYEYKLAIETDEFEWHSDAWYNLALIFRQFRKPCEFLQAYLAIHCPGSLEHPLGPWLFDLGYFELPKDFYTIEFIESWSEFSSNVLDVSDSTDLNKFFKEPDKREICKEKSLEEAFNEIWPSESKAEEMKI